MCVSYEFKLFAPEVTRCVCSSSSQSLHPTDRNCSNGIMYFYREKAELWCMLASHAPMPYTSDCVVYSAQTDADQ